MPSLGPFYIEILEGASMLRSAGILLVIATTSDDNIALRWSPSWQRARTASSSPDISRRGRRDSRGRSLPLVAVDRPGSLSLSVKADLDGAGYLLARHLVEDGRVGLITHETRSPTSCRSRPDTGATAEAGLRADRPPSSARRLRGLRRGSGGGPTLAGADRPTGLVAIADLLAIRAMRRLRHAGLAPGTSRDGHRDNPLAATVEPALTSVAYRRGP
jgi:DNA-binding LacI/PurR family transcriptional regulator